MCHTRGRRPLGCRRLRSRPQFEVLRAVVVAHAVAVARFFRTAWLQLSDSDADAIRVEVSHRTSLRWSLTWDRLGRQVRHFAGILGQPRSVPGQVYVVGNADFEPWHFTAHLAENALRSGRTDLSPTLLRWSIPEGAPRHLSVGVDSLVRLSRRDTVLVVDPAIGDASGLLERISDSRDRGARIMAVHRDRPELESLSHEVLCLDPRRPNWEFDVVQHVISDRAPFGKT